MFRDHPVLATILNVTLGIWLVPEILLVIRTRIVRLHVTAQDRYSGLAVAGSVGLAIFAASPVAHWLPGASLPGSRIATFAVGFAIMVGGIVLRWYSIWSLRRYFTMSVLVQQGQRVVRAGPYRFVRHPSYTGALITLLGLGIALGNWVSIAVLVVVPMAGFWYRIHVEEEVLMRSLGDDYEAYMRETKRLIPGFI